ncbi:hypothetical protein ABW19_dt0208207 [Dactylella cylindrospora]|nr:hypothetical protein ABW19_dt0208207 [Dactylella cylindrospora]
MPRCYKQKPTPDGPTINDLRERYNISQTAWSSMSSDEQNDWASRRHSSPRFPRAYFFYAHLQFASLLREQLRLRRDPEVFRAVVHGSAGYKAMMYYDVPMLVESRFPSDDSDSPDDMYGVIFEVMNQLELNRIWAYVGYGRTYKESKIMVTVTDPMYEGLNPREARIFTWRRGTRHGLREGLFDIDAFRRAREADEVEDI